MKLSFAAFCAATCLVPPGWAMSSPLADLPWEDLESQLSSSAVLLTGSPQIYFEECTSVFQTFPIADRSNLDLNTPTSTGLCMQHLACGYEQCYPSDFETAADWAAGQTSLFQDDSELIIRDEFLDPENARFELPYKVLHPTNAGDIVRAVQFAAQNNIEISVKNSGHNYNGASTKKDSLLIYTKSLPKYSKTDFEDCTMGQEGVDILNIDFDESLRNQPCELARARKVRAAIRVGGGENFDDFYGSVHDYNEIAQVEMGSYQYHPVGGFAATVTPMGWTFQGGLPGNQMGRDTGYGVDQVLQVEMVLPDGSHVKFGPTEWEDAEGYRFPKTLQVSGVCNENPFAEDESDYVWVPCTNGVDFNDLWFAVRGGGGGTWGVVVSMYLQLHEYPGLFQQMGFDLEMTSTLAGCNATETECEGHRLALSSVAKGYLFDYYFEPELVTGLSPVEARRCGAPILAPLFCFGVGEGVISAWKTRLIENTPNLIEEVGVPAEMIEIAEDILSIDLEVVDFLHFLQAALDWPEGHRHYGRVRDQPQPTQSTGGGGNTIMIPLSVIRENRDLFEPILTSYNSAAFYMASGPQNTDDQMSSVGPGHRGAGMMAISFPNEQADLVFQAMFEGLDYNSDFPGSSGSNHVHPLSAGPLRTDWTKACPMEWSVERRREECFTQQEAIYGTKQLRRLEQIKADIDPLRIFNCAECITPAVTVPEEDDSTPEDSSEDSGAVQAWSMTFASLVVLQSWTFWW